MDCDGFSSTYFWSNYERFNFVLSRELVLALYVGSGMLHLADYSP